MNLLIPSREGQDESVGFRVDSHRGTSHSAECQRGLEIGLLIEEDPVGRRVSIALLPGFGSVVGSACGHQGLQGKTARSFRSLREKEDLWNLRRV